jgi:hypothetical protein
MLALWLIAAHLVGDYLIQTRWQAVGKFGWTKEACWFRTRHVAGYLIPFVPIVFVYGSALEAVGFLAWLYVLHWFTDAQRFTVTPGEWLVCFWGHAPEFVMHANDPRPRLEPNPWPSLPLAIDQTLHIVQLAILGGWFLT